MAKTQGGFKVPDLDPMDGFLTGDHQSWPTVCRYPSTCNHGC